MVALMNIEEHQVTADPQASPLTCATSLAAGCRHLCPQSALPTMLILPSRMLQCVVVPDVASTALCVLCMTILQLKNEFELFDVCLIVR